MNRTVVSTPRAFRLALVLGVLSLACARTAAAQAKAVADVVVVVDTSTSMTRPNMDPQRSSLLVTKLLADVVPGNLAVVRLLGIGPDKNLIPSEDTGERRPCLKEGVPSTCTIVRPTSIWSDDARKKKLGALVRPARGDASFKGQLGAHLQQDIENSMFDLGFRAAQGIFDDHPSSSDVQRVVVWLSDGDSEHKEDVQLALNELKSAGVLVDAIVFGGGDLRFATTLGLSPEQVSTPAQVMKAFANAFRRMVRAPYRLDDQISTNASFPMKAHIDEAWIIVYGDDTLSEASLSGPAGATVRVDYAQDRHQGAGAYRVAYLTKPSPGTWTVHATGGGAGAAYAVIQRSGLTPALLGPTTTMANVTVPVVVEVRSSDGQPLKGADVPEGLRLDAQVEGKSVQLFDDGSHGDAQGGDGRYTAEVKFGITGDSKVTVRAHNDVIDRSIDAVVKVSGLFHPHGPTDVDLGRLPHHNESCRPIVLEAEHVGIVPLEMRLLRSLPAAHRLEIRRLDVRAPQGVLREGGPPVPVAPGDALFMCLVTDAAPSSVANGEPWVELRPAGSQEPGAIVRLRWQVDGMTFWARWGVWILGLLALIILAFVVYGFIVPFRFGKSLALVFVADRRDLDEESPQPLAQWSGVGIGWYRDARAYLHPNFRVSGHARDAVASLRAIRGGTLVKPENGQVLYREGLDGDWEAVPAEGRPIRSGEPYRVGDRGPFFSTSVRRM